MNWSKHTSSGMAEHFFVFGAISVVWVAAAWLPQSLVEGGPRLCMAHRLGLPCAGDGLTRAFVALFHGDLERSQTFHAGAPVVVVVLLVFWARAALSLARR